MVHATETPTFYLRFNTGKMSIPEKEMVHESKSGNASLSPPHSDIEIGIVEETTTNGDEALKFLKTAHDVGVLTAEGERRLVRKIDWMIMPLMWCCYCLQYLDKTLGMLALYSLAQLSFEKTY
jgi:hypothetical protein